MLKRTEDEKAERERHEFIKSTAAEIRYCEGPGSHPDALPPAHRKLIDRMVEEIYQNRQVEIADRKTPVIKLKGRGGHFLVGIDCEWCGNGPILKGLSYQFFGVGIGGDFSAIFYPRKEAPSERLAFSELLPVLVHKALEAGVILDYPSAITIFGYFLRADLAMFSDLVEFKTELTNVGGKIATPGCPIEFSMQFREKDLARTALSTNLRGGGGHQYVLPVYLQDVSRHAPAGGNLEQLGELIGVDKIDLTGYDKSRMDILKTTNPELFVNYALRDAEIAVKYAIEILKFARSNVWNKNN